MTNEPNAFTTCAAVALDDGTWVVQSVYWKLPMTNKRTAKFVAEIIQGAWRHGRASKARELWDIIAEGMPRS